MGSLCYLITQIFFEERFSVWMREKRFLYNTVSSFVFQITTITCGFVLPRLILQSFGSEVNGLVNSITQFLNIISFLELGVGSVVTSSLYKPLAYNEINEVSKIIASSGKFFKRLAQILFIYVIVLAIGYPYIANQEFGWMYTAGLIVAMSISSFAQYYFGVVDRLLLSADQRGYIHYTVQTITLLLNTAACVILIKLSGSIHIVKLTTSLIYLLRPVFLRAYVNKHYHLNRNIHYTEEPIKQKWNGVAQHVAAVVLDGTDNIVLTLFSTLSNVSIYSVYNMVISGVKQLLLSMTGGIQALLGELWAKQEIEDLRKTFGWFEWAMHTGTVLIFGCTGTLILSFVEVYTKGITDANYIQPLFAILIVVANAGHCMRLPYNVMILAGGHYKQTQHNYIVAVILNIVISVVSVKTWGLIGVAIGTLISMFYQTIWMAIYDSKNLICWPIRNFVKQILVDGVTVCTAAFASSFFRMGSTTYISWMVLAIKVAFVWIGVIMVVNYLFYRDRVQGLLKKLYGKRKKRQ